MLKTVRGTCTVSTDSVADPGFPRRGKPQWGFQPIILTNFYQKLHENEIIWRQGHARDASAPWIHQWTNGGTCF